MPRKTSKTDEPLKKPKRKRKARAAAGAADAAGNRFKADQFEQMDGAECTWFKKA